MAQAFAAQGAKVVFTYGKSTNEANALVKTIQAQGGQAEAHQADASNPQQLASTLAALGKKLGKIHVLINNAGVFLDTTMTETSATENFTTMMNVNVLSVFLGTHALLPYLAEGGRIINLGSVMGQSAMWPNFSGYTASKFAVAGLSSGWTYDLAPRKITVNTIEPGPINTEMNPENSPMADFMRSNVPLGRYGQPQEVVDLALFLASPAAGYITGARISIGGGIHA
jgi:NAD(P)-dependent dehydrogenase (short-subunit alcohol dehydrogenase family)